jgi:cytochrome P450
MVTGHAEARALLADARVSADRTRPGYPLLPLSGDDHSHADHKPTLLEMDDPEHSRVRRTLIPDFTVARLKELRADVEQLVLETLDTMLAAGPPADLVTDFAQPLPSLVIGRLLGVPREDRDFFQQATWTMARYRGEHQGGEALASINTYLSELAEDPPAGLLKRLKEEQVATGAMELADLVSHALFVLSAGYQVTASMISLSVITLLEHPEQLALLRSGPDAIPGVIDELLRLTVFDIGPRRIATEDIEIGGTVIKAGDGIVIGSSMANRDPSAFEDPDRFDVSRDLNHHLVFGFGVHQCLGHSLARMVLQLALSTLFERIPSLRLAGPVEELYLRPTASIPVTLRSVDRLPVEW